MMKPASAVAVLMLLFGNNAAVACECVCVSGFMKPVNCTWQEEARKSCIGVCPALDMSVRSGECRKMVVAGVPTQVCR